MVKIRLFCAAGMSTSLLVNKMKEAAKTKKLEVDIEAFPEGQMEKHVDGIDVALLGPQVGYTLSKAKKTCEPKGIPVAVIPMQDYGMMNGQKVLDFALNLIKK
ncbi:PTS sugar transporter subunit IIB [Clostridium butyricum]|uniref:PTS sugar transporter subunit IIB n=1 Tax=Clostridium butyricum TaxID=1492 RepID=UPI00374E525A